MKVIGMISGTSYDAVDVAAAEFTRTGDVLWLDPLGDLELLYPDGVRDAIAGVLPPAPSSAERICQLTTRLGKVFAETAVKGVGLAGGDADLVVSHGQTVYHWVADGHARGTLQLGEPAWIAERTGLPVLSNLRSADIARGGHGAPLAPTLDALLLPPASTPGAALNLGGIANLTVIRPDGSLLGYDVGPANALIDAAGTELAGVPYDAGGAIARSGRVLPDLLDALLAEPYYAAPPPKSTGKELFSWPYLRRHLEQLTSPPSAPDVLA
ncbi:MAG: anhydro-N-acetylmuramic acid kinase, partial [Micromonosporaceae bacterium]